MQPAQFITSLVRDSIRPPHGRVVRFMDDSFAPATSCRRSPFVIPERSAACSMRATMKWATLATISVAVSLLAPNTHAQALSACLPGQVVNDDTRGHCCWPAQAWSSGQSRCVGIPQCGAAMRVEGEACVAVDAAPVCPAGMEMGPDTAEHCCWPAQVWAPGQQRCVGVPRCAPGFTAAGESCVAAIPAATVSVPPAPSSAAIAPAASAPVPVAVAVAVAPSSPGVTARRFAGNSPLTLSNSGNVPLCNVQMSPATQTEWGDGWMPQGEQIIEGGQRTFQVTGGQLWDIRAVSCSGNVIATMRRVMVPEAGARIELRAGRETGYQPYLQVTAGPIAMTAGLIALIAGRNVYLYVSGAIFLVGGIALSVVGGVNFARAPIVHSLRLAGERSRLRSPDHRGSLRFAGASFDRGPDGSLGATVAFVF
jgi:hypothetical protein